MKTRKIAIVFRDCKGGVRTFLEGILFALNKTLKEDGFDITLIHDQESYLSRDALNNFHQVVLPRKNKLYWDYVTSLRYLRKHDFEIIVYPKNFIPLSHRILPAKKLLNVHDLSALETQFREFGWGDILYTYFFSQPSYNLADSISADSQSTKNDMMKRFVVPDKKITVIPGAAESFFQKTDVPEAFLMQYRITDPVLFYCGAMSPRKNIFRLLQAFESIKDEIGHTLYIAGMLTYRDKQVRDFIAERLSDRVIILGKIPLEDLIRFYCTADAYVYPSLFEGFGLPILEAQQCGCPVITSNITSCPEVAGEGAEIVHPESVESIARGILNVVQNPQRRDELILKGYENARMYSWENSAKKLTECIKKL